MHRGRESGSLTLLAVFIYFLFSALGLGLICLAQLHVRVTANRKSALLLAYAAENGLEQAFAGIAAGVAAHGGPAPCSEERYAGLRSEIESGSRQIVADVLGSVPPLAVAGEAGDQAWNAGTDFALGKIAAEERFFIADFRGAARSVGRLSGFIPEKSASLDVSLRVLAGRVPLAYFPILFAGPRTAQERDALASDASLVPVAAPGAAAPPALSFSEDAIDPAEADLLLKKAARVKFLTPGRLSRGELRAALGLEMVNEPIPEGVYLIESDAGLGGVFVQGDIERMVLAIDGTWQEIAFLREDGAWLLKYSLAEGRTVFLSPEGPREFARVPLGIILVNGAVGELGGGRIGPDGSAEIDADSTEPCVLRGAALTIVASDEVTISSPLIQQGVKWVDGLPYLKDSTSQLVLYASGQDLVGGEKRAGNVIIDPHAPRDIALQASITAAAEFRSEGASRTVTVAGGVQAGGIALNGAMLRVRPDERLREPEWTPDNAPATARPLIAVLALKPLAWRGE